MTRHSSQPDGHAADAVADEVRRLWVGRLQPIQPRLLRKELPEPTRTFLAEVGLPTQAPFVAFYHDERLGDPVSTPDGTFYAVAAESLVVLALRAGTSELWAVQPEGLVPQRFVNSDLASFLVFLGYLDARLAALRDAEDEQAARVMVDELRHEFLACDQQALVEPESWWNLVLAQAVDGYL